MTLAALDEICEIQIGKTPSRSKPEYWGGALPWVTISDISGGRVANDTKECITDRGAAESGAKLIPEGTLLFSFKLSLGKRAFAGCDLYTNEAIAALRIRDRSVIHDRFLYWALGAVNYDEMVDRAAKGKTLNKAKLKRIPIPLPPLAEQKRIAGILDAADALRAKRRESLAQLDTLIQATFLDMFGDPAKHGWHSVQVEDLADDEKGAIRTGPFGSQLLHSEFVDAGIRVLGIDNAVNNEFREGEPRFITPEKYEQLKRYTVRPGDVLITIMGTCGRCAVVPDDIDTAINTKHLCCISLNKQLCLPSFLHAFFLLHPMARDYLQRNAKGAIMSGLNMGIIKKLPVPSVPIELQYEFSRRVRCIREQADKCHQHLDDSESLFNSLQACAFAGEW